MKTCSWWVYLALLIVAAVSFWLAKIFSEYGFITEPTSISAAGALLGIIIQIFRDDAAFKKSQILQNENNDFILAATSHMANVAFDKHTAFAEKYLMVAEEELKKLFHTGLVADDLGNVARDAAFKLFEVRKEFGPWVTKEIREELEPFERELSNIYANEGLVKSLPMGKHRSGAVEAVTTAYKKLADVKEPGAKDEAARGGAIQVKESLQTLLGIPDLTALRKIYVDEAIRRQNKPKQQPRLLQIVFVLLITGACHSSRAGTNSVAVQETKAKAEKGDTEAQYDLGWAYCFGVGTAKIDSDEAIKWFRMAAEKNHSSAEWMLGFCYSETDKKEAALWIAKAAQHGHMLAQNDLGALYAEGGPGTPKNLTKAIQWYRKSAEQGHSTAQYNLGVCYAVGNGVPKDYVQAYKWFSLASASGQTWDESTSASAKENLEIAEARMTPGQVAEAQRLAREFKPRKESGSGNSASPTTPTASGTGFFISDDGYLISNNHVVEGANQVRLVTSKGLISAKVVKVDAANDLALLKAEGRFAPLPLFPSRGVKLGGTVATVGFPNIGLQGFAPKLAKGEIASLSGAGDDARYFQISVPVQPGNSGGALVDERGNVVGVVSAKLNAGAALRSSGALPENVNYAVKSSYLLSFLESVPDVASKLKEPSAKEKKFEDVVKEAEQAAVLVLVY